MNNDVILWFDYWTRDGKLIVARVNNSHEARVIRAREAA